MSSISDFISSNGALAASVSQNTGVPVADILGQWGLETGWGSHYAGTNNPGNISPGGNVANYSTPQAGADAYQSVLQSYNIDSSTPTSFAASVAAGGYATDPNYASKLQGAIASVNNSNVLQPFTDYLQTFMQVATPSVASTGSAAANGGSTSTPVTQWISSHVANYGIVFFGGVLIVGALLISQRQTVVQLAKSV